jgi:hypothetical protein
MSQHTLLDRIGVVVTCATCGHAKKPIGRSAALGTFHCDAECPGYRQEPLPGSLWPGERASEFGYPCSNEATEPIGGSSPE